MHDIRLIRIKTQKPKKIRSHVQIKILTVVAIIGVILQFSGIPYISSAQDTDSETDTAVDQTLPENSVNPDAVTPPNDQAFTIQASKVVCLSEKDLPNWGTEGAAGKPVAITATTATDFVAASNGQCSLQPDWSFQYGFAAKDGQEGVDKLPGDFIGAADGTSTLGQCDPTFCGNNTATGTNYQDWKTFDTATSASGTVAASASISDLSGAPGVWVREDLKPGFIPFVYPPDGPPGSNVSAELYCHTDIFNFDNYDQVTNPAAGNTYYCVAFNAPKAITIKAAKVVCLSEADLPNWGDSVTKPSSITATTASDFVAASDNQCKLESDWSFQYGFAAKDNQVGVNKLPGDFIGAADGTSTLGQCDPTFCGNNTATGTNYQDWKGFDSATGAGAVAAQVQVSDLQGAPGIWVRENLQTGYIPFVYPPDGPPGSDVSAEIYCHTDIVNYDNFDEIKNPQTGQTYYCVAFNALKPVDHGGGGGGGNGPFTLTVNTTGEGEGVVTSADGFINCDSKSAVLIDCVHTYPAGTAVVLTATANPGSTFIDTWSVACSGNDPICNLTMNSNLAATAHFSIASTGGGGGGGGCLANCSSGGGGGGSSGFVNPPPPPPVTPPATDTGSVLGSNITNTNNPPQGQVEAAVTELPRTGLPVGSLALFALLIITTVGLIGKYKFSHKLSRVRVRVK